MRPPSQPAGAVIGRGGGKHHSSDDEKTIWPSAWAIAGPAATYLTAHVAAQRTSMVFAPPSVATRRSPARMPARASPAAGSCIAAASCLSRQEPVQQNELTDGAQVRGVPS